MQTFGLFLVDESELDATLRVTSDIDRGSLLRGHAQTRGADWGTLRIRASELQEFLERLDATARGLRTAELAFAGVPPGADGPIVGAGYIARAEVARAASAVAELSDNERRHVEEVPEGDVILQWLESALAMAARREMGILVLEL